MAAIDTQITVGQGPFGYAAGEAEVAQQIIADFVTRRDVVEKAFQNFEDMNFFMESMSTYFMKTGRTVTTNTTKHTHFERGSRFKAVTIGASPSVSGSNVTITLATNSVFNIGTVAAPNYVSPGIVRQYVLLDGGPVQGQITAVSKPVATNNNHTITIACASAGDAALFTAGKKMSFLADSSKEKDTFPQGMSQTDSRFDVFFQYMMTSQPEITMLAGSLMKQYSVQGKYFEDLIAKLDTYVRHEILKSIDVLIADGSSYNGRQKMVGIIPLAKAFGYSDLSTDLSTPTNNRLWLRDVVRYARGAGQMGSELTHFMGFEFKTGLSNLLDQGIATQTNIRYDAFGGDGGARDRALKLGFASIVDSEAGFTHHIKPVREYAHPELMNTKAGTGTSASYYELTDTVVSAGRGYADVQDQNSFAVAGSVPEFAILNLEQRNGDGTQALRNEIFQGSAILGYEASRMTLTETTAFRMQGAKKSMFFYATAL
jgi:hypothetical protein